MEKQYSFKLDSELAEKLDSMEGTTREKIELLLNNTSAEKDAIYAEVKIVAGERNASDIFAEMKRCYKRFSNYVIVPPQVDTKDKALEFLKIPKFSKEETVFSMGAIETVRFYQKRL